MSNTRSPFDPAALGDEAVDEALSALLDDELDDWAADHGLDPVEARRALEALPAFQARRVALAAARETVRAAPTAALDDVTRRRFVRTAVQEASPAKRERPSWFQRPLAAAAAAIVVLVLVGGGLFAVLRDTGGSQPRGVATGTSNRAAKSAGGVAGSGAYAGNLGDVSDPSMLRARVEGDPRVSVYLSPPAPAGAATGKPGPAASTTPSTTTAPPSSTTPGLFDVRNVPESSRRCVQVVAESQPAGQLLLVGDASYHSGPAVVVVVRDDGRVTTYVSDQRTCAVLASQSSKLP